MQIQGHYLFLFLLCIFLLIYLLVVFFLRSLYLLTPTFITEPKIIANGKTPY